MFTTFSALESFPAQLERVFENFPAGYRNWSPGSWDGVPSETFTAQEQICHVRDIEIRGYRLRFRRLLEEDHPTLASIDGYELAKELRYAESDPAEVFETFREARRENLRIIRALSAEELRRTGFFPDYGEINLRSLIHFLCSHDQQHLAGMQWLLGKIEAAQIKEPQKAQKTQEDF